MTPSQALDPAEFKRNIRTEWRSAAPGWRVMRRRVEFPSRSCVTSCSPVPAAQDFLALAFRMDFRAVDFRPLDFRAVVLRAVDFLALDFRAVDFLALDFRAVVLRAVDFLELDFRAVDFRLPDFPAVDFLALDFRPLDFRAVVFGLDFDFRDDGGLRPPARAAFSFTAPAASSALSTAISSILSTTAPTTPCAVSVARTFFPVFLTVSVTFRRFGIDFLHPIESVLVLIVNNLPDW